MQLSERLNNRYEVIRQLGDGGFGTTFLVRDHQIPSARQCVVKQLKPLNENSQIYEIVKDRFQREAAILEKLGEHDQIPRLYAYFSEADRFYLVEEYVEGDTLTQKVQKEGKQSEDVVRSVLINLLPAIVHVHQQQIVHRDIKPDNIVLRQADQKPVLIDFGAVKETMGTVINTKGNSSHSIVVGTPGYMPSEQLAGRPIYSSDLYSLGLTAIYMLTGKIPQELDTDPMTGAVLWRVHAPHVSEALAALIDRTIQMTPAHRFGTAQEMFMALSGLSIGVTLPPNSQFSVQPSATVVSMPPAVYSSVPTQAVMPQSYAQQPPSQVYAAAPGGEWKKMAMLGGIIGLSILGAAFVMKNNAPSPVASSTPTPIAVASPTPSPATSPTPSPTTSPATGGMSAARLQETMVKPVANPEPVIKPEANLSGTIVGDSGPKDIRSGPGMKYDSPHIAYSGDRVQVIATTQDASGNTWRHIVFPKSGADGWIGASSLEIGGGSAPEPVVKKATESNATIVGGAGSKNIRSGPGMNYDSPHIAYAGDRVKVIDIAQDKTGHTWHKIYFPKSGADGWIASELLSIED
jgi:serine/threonine protein kinase, bacterial